jgi:hypothetical protein
LTRSTKNCPNSSPRSLDLRQSATPPARSPWSGIFSGQRQKKFEPVTGQDSLTINEWRAPRSRMSAKSRKTFRKSLANRLSCCSFRAHHQNYGSTPTHSPRFQGSSLL